MRRDTVSITKVDGPDWVWTEDNELVISAPKVDKPTEFNAIFRAEKNQETVDLPTSFVVK